MTLTKGRKRKFQRPKGTYDILPEEFPYFDFVLKACEKTAKAYNFKRIETPIIEQAGLFSRGVGLNTEIVEKQMYVFKTRGKDIIALRPEGTAPVVRAYIENGLEVLPKPVKLWYFGPFFRYEKPQAGRYRQFWQFGFESLGEESPAIDVQMIQIFVNILNLLKIKKVRLEINSIGDQNCRPYYKRVLTTYLRQNQKRLCRDCKRRLKTNPLRILDCKNEKCQPVISEAPQTIDYLCKECHQHFKSVLEMLDELGIEYNLNSRLVRGLDYYTRTVFEIFEKENKIAFVGGGRYDGLVKTLGGVDTPGCGAAGGIERIISVIKEKGIEVRKEKKPKIFLAQLGPLGKRKALKLFEEFRKANIYVAEAFGKDSLKSQLARADQLGARYVLILAQKEALEGQVILRDMKTGKQKIIEIKKVVEKIKKLLS